MGRRIISSLLAMALIFSLPVFSLADGGEVILKDSGSPAVSLMALRSIAADEGISLAASEGNSGQFGYNIYPVDLVPNSVNRVLTSSGYLFEQLYFYLYPGTYKFDAMFSSEVYSSGVYFAGGSALKLFSRSGLNVSDTFVIDTPGLYNIQVGSSASDLDVDSLFIVDYSLSSIVPVEGISSGYTFNSGVINDNNISARLEYVTWDFGSQSAGNYLINIYTYGQNYDVDFDIVVGSDITQDRKVAVSKSNGLYTCLISHGGGDLVLEANFSYKKSTLNSPLGGSGSTNGTWYEGTGSVFGTSTNSIVSSGNWIFNITDVVAVPLGAAGLEQFGVFGPLVGFLRDGFSSIKSNVVIQFSQLKTALTTEFNNLKTSITTQFTQLKTALTTEFNNLKTTITTQFTQLKTQLTTQYNGMKTFLEQQITRIVGDDDTENDVQDAADELNKEVQDLQSLSGDLNTQSGNLQQQFTTDFAVPDQLTGNASSIQAIYNFLFSSLGIFSIFIWLPVVLAVIKKLLRL